MSDEFVSDGSDLSIAERLTALWSRKEFDGEWTARLWFIALSSITRFFIDVYRPRSV